MKREDRAKQFLPFDAMKGLSSAMKKQEEKLTRVEKIELGEEDAAAISATLSRLQRGDNAEVTFFTCGRYITARGTVTALDETKRTLTIDDHPVPFDDILSIVILPGGDL